MKSKKWYVSKTVWFNVITATLGVVQVLSGTIAIPTEVLTAIVGIGNVLLRLVTTDGIEKSAI